MTMVFPSRKLISNKVGMIRTNQIKKITQAFEEEMEDI